jgi:hypothetical protein
MSATGHSERRLSVCTGRFRFTLLSLLGAIAVLSAILGFVVRAERRRAIVTMIQQDGYVAYSGETLRYVADRHHWIGDQTDDWRVYMEQVTGIYMHYGACSDEDLLAICEFRGIRELELFGSVDLTSDGLRRIDRLQDLRVLDLTEAQLDSSGISLLGRCKNLEVLVLRHTQVNDDGMKHLAMLRELRELRLPSGITSRGLKDLAPLTKLQILTLEAASIDDEGMAVLASFPELRELDVSQTQVTDEGVRHLAGLGRLEVLNLADLPGITSRSARVLATMKSLRELTLINTGIDDTVVMWLSRLDGLRALELLDCNVTSDGLDILRRKLPRCRIGSGSSAEVGGDFE